jgi:hypothetical protein
MFELPTAWFDARYSIFQYEIPFSGDPPPL